jgi:hypothetical protein
VQSIAEGFSNCAAIAPVHTLQARRAINPAAFGRASHEFKACQVDMRLHLQLLNDLVCPACSEGLAAVHIDANLKNFTWDRNRETWRTPHYTEFFLHEQAVKRTLDALDLATGNKVGACCSFGCQFG